MHGMVKSAILHDWGVLGTEARKISVTHYLSLIELRRYCIRLNIEPRLVNDEVLSGFYLYTTTECFTKAKSLFRASIKYWNDLEASYGFPLNRLAPTANSRCKSSALWAALPVSLTNPLAPLIGPTGPNDAPTRHRTNISSAIAYLNEAALPFATPEDLLSVEALDTIAESIATNAKRHSVLLSLAALAKILDDNAAHSRVRATIKAEVYRCRTINAAVSIKIDRAMSAATLDRLEFYLTGVVLTICYLEPGGRIEQTGYLRPLTRRNLLPRAQDAMAAIAILQTRVKLRELSGYCFEVAADDDCSLSHRRENGHATVLDLGSAANALLNRLRQAMIVHANCAPRTLFDMVGKPGRTRRLSNIRQGITELLNEAGVPLTSRGLRDLSERLVVDIAASIEEAAVGTGKQRVDDFERRQGCEFAATAASIFAQQELAADNGEATADEADSVDLVRCQ